MRRDGTEAWTAAPESPQIHNSVAPDKRECGARNVGFPELRLDEFIHMTETRPLRLCVARPSKECQKNERATYSAMDGCNLSYSFHRKSPFA
jgi:hypothetical protein